MAISKNDPSFLFDDMTYMKHASYTEIIHSLQASLRVRGIFATGTTASTLTPSSDIDLVVIVDKNIEEIKSVYTTIENRFADIFFFDVAFTGTFMPRKLDYTRFVMVSTTPTKHSLAR